MEQPAPVPGPAQAGGLNSALERNIEALRARQQEQVRRSGFQERLADAITGFAGSMGFVYLHLAIVGFWIVANVGWIEGVRR